MPSYLSQSLPSGSFSYVKMSPMNIIFTDGASRGNPGPGGWGAIVVSGDKVVELGGREDRTTNNKMEMTAAMKGLQKVAEGEAVTVYTDSSYLINGITKWVKGWKSNGWQTKTKQDVLNRDIWMELDELASSRQIKWEYVGGHVGVAGNERCDFIATSFADEERMELYSGPLSGYSIKNITDVSHNAALAAAKGSSSSRSKAKAYSYISMVDRKIEKHATWAECEKRVKGVRGARYKKALDATEEGKVIGEFTNI